MTNQEKFTLFAINFSLKVRFRENILSDDGRSSRSGEITKERDWPLAISKIDPGKSFTFYALTQGTNYANASFPQTASYFDPATNEQKEVRLLLLGWDSLGVTPATINSQKSQH